MKRQNKTRLKALWFRESCPLFLPEPPPLGRTSLEAPPNPTKILVGGAQLLRGRKMSGSNVEEKVASKQCSEVQVRPDSAWEGSARHWDLAPRKSRNSCLFFFFYFLNEKIRSLSVEESFPPTSLITVGWPLTHPITQEAEAR